MQRIRRYLVGHPEQVEELLNANPSYVFFRLAEDGPFGAMGRALTPMVSMATDPLSCLWAPFWPWMRFCRAGRTALRPFWFWRRTGAEPSREAAWIFSAEPDRTPSFWPGIYRPAPGFFCCSKSNHRFPEKIA